MSWKQTNDLNKTFTLGLNAEINVEELTTSGKFFTNLPNYTTNAYTDICINKFKSATFAGDVSFTKNIHARDASFQRLGSNSEQALMFVDDASFGSSIQGNDASFIYIGSTDGNILKIIDDVSFSQSIRARDASFHHLGSNSEQALIFSDDVSFGGSVHGNDASFSSIGAKDGNNLIIKDDVSFNGGISADDACFNTIGPANGNLEFLTDVSFNGRIRTSNGDAKFSRIDSLTVNSEDVEFIFEPPIQGRKGGDLIGGQTDAQAGSSTALSEDGNVVAVGATAYDYTNDGNEGRVQVFDYTGGSWVQRGSDLSGGQVYASAGSSTALSADGNVVAVGTRAYGYNDYEGRVQVFDYSGGSWVQRGSDLSGGQGRAYAGWSTALSEDGNVVAVGSSAYNYGNDSNVGRVQVFDYTGGSWVQRGSDLSGGQASAYAGWSNSTALSEDGNVVAVGAYGYNNYVGRVQVFDYTGGSWVQRGLDLSGGQAGAQAGSSTALSADGNVVAVGASGYNYGIDNNAGRVQVFDYSGNSWVQRGLDLSGGVAVAQAGYSTGLSADGNVVAVGSSSYGNGNEGRVQVFDYSGNAWVQRDSGLTGGQNYAYAGTSTALSADGKVVAVGATGYGNGNEGRVQVFYYSDKINLSDIIDSIITGDSI